MLIAILAIAAALRIWLPWDNVMGGPRVNFLENDAWYHVRLAESQVRHFPHRLTVDPFAAPDGQYIAVAPLLDATTATVAFLIHGRDASNDDIERIAAIVPAVTGVLSVLAVWALAAAAFNSRAGLLAALFAAIFPGHFLDRTLIGFVDHHALEVFLSFATLAALAYGSAVGAGISLGLYLLAWASGAYFVFILAAWIFLAGLFAPAFRAAAAKSTVITALIALAIVLAFQDPALFRYNTQVAALLGLLLTALAVWYFGHHLVKTMVIVAVGLSIAIAAAWIVMPGLVGQVLNDIGRFRPDPTRMAVLEARPLFLYTGNWSWRQPWVFFRTGFFIGGLATAALVVATWRSRRADHLLILTFTVANYLAALGQNRFAYYLVPATAVVSGWLCGLLLDWTGVSATDVKAKRRWQLPFQRELAVMAIAGIAVGPNVVPSIQAARRSGGMPEYWADAMQWLRDKTPEPFSSPDYYYARVAAPIERASYTIMNWWDQGYWIVQAAHRVPVSNPTQGGAPASAGFLTADNESTAIERLSAQRAKYVIVDWELPFRDGRDGALEGRFQSVADWAGEPTSRYYAQCFTRRTEVDPWQPIWIYREPYYQTMLYRLMVLGGQASHPTSSTWVVHIQQRVDSSGRNFCDVTERTPYTQPEEAKMIAALRGPGFEAVGLSPWQPAFPAPAVEHFRLAAEFRDPGQRPSESAMIKIFELIPPATP